VGRVSGSFVTPIATILAVGSRSYKAGGVLQVVMVPSIYSNPSHSTSVDEKGKLVKVSEGS